MAGICLNKALGAQSSALKKKLSQVSFLSYVDEPALLKITAEELEVCHNCHYPEGKQSTCHKTGVAPQ